MALAGIIIAVLSPIFGAIADFHGRRKIWLGTFTLFVIVSSSLLWYAYPHPSYVNFVLACVIVGTVALNLCMVFYNALLPYLAPSSFIGRISGWGWGLGYLGGVALLLITFYGFIHQPPSWLNPATFEQIRFSGPLVALWTLVFAIPLFVMVPEPASSQLNMSQAIRSGLKDLLATIKMLLQQKTILVFLIAQMIYIDALNTIFAFGGIYAAGTFHMDMSEVLLFGIAMSAFAGLGSILLAWVDDMIGSKPTILLSLFFLTTFGLGVVLITTKTGFWILACLLSLFVGSVQSSSRSLMTHLVPKEKATEMFGFYVLSGKITMFVGPWIVGTATLYFNSQRVGMGSVLSLFVIGAIILSLVRNPQEIKPE